MSTSTVATLLSRVRAYGAELVPAPVEYRVSIRSQKRLPDELLAELKKNKPELLSYLRQCSYYRFRLRGGAGSIFRAETSDLVAARVELVEAYGDRLVVVAPAWQAAEQRLPLGPHGGAA